MIWRLVKLLLFMIILGGAALVIYAYAGPLFFPADFAAPTAPVSLPVTLDVN